MAKQRQIRIAVKNPRFTPGMQTRDIALFRLFDLGPRLRLIQSLQLPASGGRAAAMHFRTKAGKEILAKLVA